MIRKYFIIINILLQISDIIIDDIFTRNKKKGACHKTRKVFKIEEKRRITKEALITVVDVPRVMSPSKLISSALVDVIMLFQ
jgi:hypothetical protein